jgi:hypothetical protein
MTDVVEKMVDAMLATELDVVLWSRETVRELALAAKRAYEEQMRLDIKEVSDRHVQEMIWNLRR